jgi:hypothetical protein
VYETTSTTTSIAASANAIFSGFFCAVMISSFVPFALSFPAFPPTTLFQWDSQFAQIEAQATCSSLISVHGFPPVEEHVGGTHGLWIFAVARDCNIDSRTCDDICDSLTEDQAGKLHCGDSLHLYQGAGYATNVSQLGLKTAYEGQGSCASTECGPNYCCCVGTGP